MQYVYGALMLVAFIFLLLMIGAILVAWNDRKYPDIPRVIKTSHYIYGRLIWRVSWCKIDINPIRDKKSFRIVNWDEGIISTQPKLEIGDILVVQGKKHKQIVIMVIFDNGCDERSWNQYETAFIGVYEPA